MKILYVLVSSESDFYYEQALISMMSAKYQMPNCTISLLTERETDNSLKASRNLINEYLSEKVVIDLDSSLSPMQKSRWLKTSMRKYVKGDFLYVDVDTVFAAPIDETLFSEDIMGVPDGNCPLKTHPMRWFIEDNLKKVHFSNTLDYHINSGVLFFKDTPIALSFAEKWHERWIESCQKEIFIDQPALHQTVVDTKCILKLLPNYMNAQFGRNINTLAKAVILHYYSSWANDSLYKPAYKLLQKDFLAKVRENPKSKIVLKLIQNPKEAFDENTYIMTKDYSEFINSELIQNLLRMRLSEDKADLRLYTFLMRHNQLVKHYYYKVIKVLYPIKKFFTKK